MNRHHVTTTSPYLVFFRPRETASVGRDSSLLLPLLLAGVLRTINTWLDARVAAEPPVLFDWVLTPLEPILLALAYHGIARLVLHRTGQLLHLIKLFSYASIGMDTFLMPMILVTVAFPHLLWFREILGGLIFLYWLYVAGHFSRVNYSLATREVAFITVGFVVLAMLLAFAAGYVGYRLSIPGGYPMLNELTQT